jgi:hypothetical protein
MFFHYVAVPIKVFRLRRIERGGLYSRHIYNFLLNQYRSLIQGWINEYHYSKKIVNASMRVYNFHHFCSPLSRCLLSEQHSSELITISQAAGNQKSKMFRLSKFCQSRGSM